MSERSLQGLLRQIRACRICRDNPADAPLPHEPNPVLRASQSARLAVVSQAPGIRVHLSGMPFDDPSGDRLRDWMGVDRATFYDERRIAIIPMGFCFPGWSAAKADLPPRRECRAHWHDALFAQLPQIETLLVLGAYAQDYHFSRLGLPRAKGETTDSVVRRWRQLSAGRPQVFALPHPSWRNSGWLKRNAWFALDVLPALREAVATSLRR